MADVPLLAMLPLAIGLLAEGRTRMFCQVSKQVTPLLLAVVTVKVICVALLDVIAAMASPPVAGSRPPTKNGALTADVNPTADAVICLLSPAALHCTPVNAAVPLPAAAPMSRLVVPSREPEPPVRASATLKLA